MRLFARSRDERASLTAHHGEEQRQADQPDLDVILEPAESRLLLAGEVEG